MLTRSGVRSILMSRNIVGRRMGSGSASAGKGEKKHSALGNYSSYDFATAWAAVTILVGFGVGLHYYKSMTTKPRAAKSADAIRLSGEFVKPPYIDPYLENKLKIRSAVDLGPENRDEIVEWAPASGEDLYFQYMALDIIKFLAARNEDEAYPYFRMLSPYFVYMSQETPAEDEE